MSRRHEGLAPVITSIWMICTKYAHWSESRLIPQYIRASVGKHTEVNICATDYPTAGGTWNSQKVTEGIGAMDEKRAQSSEHENIEQKASINIFVNIQSQKVALETTR